MALTTRAGGDAELRGSGEIMTADYFTAEQLDVLLRPIRSTRVSRDGKGFSHVEAYEIRAHLNRLLGFGRWSEEVVEQAVVFETLGAPDDPNPKARGKWSVCYRSLVRLTVRAPDGTQLAVYTEGATGDAANQPSRADAHDLALKTSQSQALKRAAVNLGDQFGLSLYNKGSMAPLVRRTVLHVVAESTSAAEVDAHLTSPLAPENSTGEPETPARETSSPPPSTRPTAVASAERDDARRTPSPDGDAPEGGDPPAPAPAPAAGDVNASAMDGQDDPEPEPAGQSAAPAPARPEPSRSSVASGQTVDGPLAEVLAVLNALPLQSPQEAIRSIGIAMTMAVRHQLRHTVVPDGSGMTVGAALTHRMKQAQAHINAAREAAEPAGTA